MKYLKLLILPLLLLVFSFRYAAPLTYSADANKSMVKWTGHAEAGGYSPSGTVKVKSGTLTLDGELLVAGKVIIDMPTLSQSNSEMETHLKGKDFFDVAAYPEATFTLSAANGNTVAGTLTIKGISQKIATPITITKAGDYIILKATLKIDRTKFNIKYNSKSYFQDLGSYAIKNEFDLDINMVYRQTDT
ncbi:YceI family protein [Mucilaginibacter xinganensis]|uniref:YceI family protein n=1 Tax=Mucilaginibacter xinganensis TaxID=1234841 RepID=A0A223NUQ2_9SPHI|nr:YceI family protein [Mucilaginibacter xinganensis]ASU33358.1 YceI family protein [Mucilaginibacter xinganensis]